MHKEDFCRIRCMEEWLQWCLDKDSNSKELLEPMGWDFGKDAREQISKVIDGYGAKLPDNSRYEDD